MKLRSIVIGLGRAGLMTDYNVKQFIKSHTKAYYLHPKFDLMCGIEKKKEIENYLIKSLIDLHIKI